MTTLRQALFLLMTVLTLSACSTEESSNVDTAAEAKASEPDTAASEPAPASSGTVLAADDAPIRWWRTGTGDTTLVMIHGWSCDQAYWREQVPALADDYTLVTLDLPGHGESGGDRDPWRVADYGKDVARVVTELELERVVLVGHSMGGVVSLATAAELEDSVIGVIAADSLHDAELKYSMEMAAPMIAGLSADYAGTMRMMFTGMSGTSMDPELVNWITERAAATRSDVGVELFANYTDLDFSEMFRNAGVPIRAINAAANTMNPATRIEANRQYADYDAVIIDGVGHFLQLEDPERFNAALREMVTALEANATTS